MSDSGVVGRGPIRAITLDFGNTLVPVDRASLAAVVETLADAAVTRFGVEKRPFLDAWGAERERQLREDVPRFREVDLAVRLRRVLARLRGVPAPPFEARWDDDAAAARSSPEEVAAGLDVYSRAFVVAIPPDPAITGLLARLAARHRLAILSNWPLAVTIDRYADSAGWTPHLAAIVVSERVGAIKPHPSIFRAAEVALGRGAERGPRGSEILHVGDDWAADVEGALRAGWRAAYLRARPADSPLPGSERSGGAVPDLVLDRLADLEVALGGLDG